MRYRQLGMLMFLVFAFAKASFSYATLCQDVQGLIPTIEERPRQITDTLDRDYDDRDLTVRDLPENWRDSYQGSDYDYEDTTEETDNFVTDFFDWFFRKLGSWFGIDIDPIWASIMKWTIYALFGGIAIYFIVKLLRGEQSSGMIARSKGSGNQIKIEETHIEEIDLNKHIADAIASGNYRNAVRYLYLNSLKKMSESGKIDWDFQKTNGDYYRELQDPALKAQFQKVSYLYDYVWYGEFAIDEHAFAKAQQEFDNLNKQAA